jgi:Protein of unknown function (DUF998)
MSAAGVVWAGVFRWRMVEGVPTETAPHVVSAITAFAATGLGFIVFSRRMKADPQWRPPAPYTMYIGIAVLLLFVTVGFFAVDAGAPLHAWAGLLQRILCAVWLAGMIVLLVRVRSVWMPRTIRHPLERRRPPRVHTSAKAAVQGAIKIAVIGVVVRLLMRQKNMAQREARRQPCAVPVPRLRRKHRQCCCAAPGECFASPKSSSSGPTVLRAVLERGNASRIISI